MACRVEQRRHGGHTDVHQELVLQIKSPTPQQPDLKLSLTEVRDSSGHARTSKLHRAALTSFKQPKASIHHLTTSVHHSCLQH